MDQQGASQQLAAGSIGQPVTGDAATVSIVSKALGKPVTLLERIGGGRNSKVYKVTCGDSATYAAKLYFHYPAGDRWRLDAEYSGLKFMWENEVRCIPKPVVADRQNDCGVYEYIEGDRILSDQVTETDVDVTADFLVGLKELANRANSENLPRAAEACFSVQAIVENIRRRLDRLVALGNSASRYQDLSDFLTKDFAPTLEVVTAWCRTTMQAAGLPFDAELPSSSRTLSPSDFGFHNALRRQESNGRDSQIVFLDFEYFGWDDPAKMISDFLLHPAWKLDVTLNRRFASNIIRRFQNCGDLAGRIEVVYPLFGLKWCLILLNEFTPEYMLRRGFVGGPGGEEGEAQVEQLGKARLMLDRISREYRHFPYYG